MAIFKNSGALALSILLFCATPVLSALIGEQSAQAQTQTYLKTADSAWKAIKWNNGNPTTFGNEKAEAINGQAPNEDLSKAEAQKLITTIRKNWGGKNVLQHTELKIKPASGKTFKVIAEVSSTLQ